MNGQYQISNIKYQNCGGIAKRQRRLQFCFLLFTFCIFLVAGCQNANEKASLVQQVKQLTEQNTKLIRQIERSESENEQLKKQIQTLSGLPDEVRLENLYTLERIKIGRYTNFIDKDKDGKKEKLIVYLQPIDDQGDLVKASGTVDVQLWDLNKDEGEALLCEWHIKPNELKKLWIAFVVINYRLVFDVADKIKGLEEPLTVKVTFTDYLSGKVFHEQKVIKP